MERVAFGVRAHQRGLAARVHGAEHVVEGDDAGRTRALRRPGPSPESRRDRLPISGVGKMAPSFTSRSSGATRPPEQSGGVDGPAWNTPEERHGASTCGSARLPQSSPERGEMSQADPAMGHDAPRHRGGTRHSCGSLARRLHIRAACPRRTEEILGASDLRADEASDDRGRGHRRPDVRAGDAAGTRAPAAARRGGPAHRRRRGDAAARQLWRLRRARLPALRRGPGRGQGTARASAAGRHARSCTASSPSSWVSTWAPRPGASRGSPVQGDRRRASTRPLRRAADLSRRDGGRRRRQGLLLGLPRSRRLRRRLRPSTRSR